MRIVPHHNCKIGDPRAEFIAETNEGIGVLVLAPIGDGQVGYHVHSGEHVCLAVLTFRPTTLTWTLVCHGEPELNLKPILVSSHDLRVALRPLFEDLCRVAEAELRMEVEAR